MRHGHRLFVGIGSLLLLPPALAAQTTEPASQPATRPAVDPEAQRQIEQLIATAQAFADAKLQGLEPVPDLEASEIVVARVEEGQVVVKANPAAPMGQFRLSLPGGEAALHLRNRRGGEPWVDVLLPEVPTPESFAPGGDGLTSGFSAYFSDPTSGRLQVSRNAEFVDGTLSVSVTQLPPEQQGYPHEPSVHLRVHFSPSGESQLDGFEPRPAVQIEASAASFGDLQREHREAFDEHVVPLMRRLGLAAILADEVRSSALQVFLSELPVTSDERAATMEALAQLDSPAFPERRAAQMRLEAIGRPAATVLANVNLDTLTAEQQTRVELVLDAFRTLSSEEAERLANDADFLHSAAALGGDPESDALAAAAKARLDAMD